MSKSIYSLPALVLSCMLVSLSGCTGREKVDGPAPETAEEPVGQSAQSTQKNPGFGDAVLVPAIELDGWSSLVAYKNEGIGYFESFGNDTTILRARGPGVAELEERERLLGGERTLEKCSTSLVLGEKIVAREKDGVIEDHFLVMSSENSSVAGEGPSGRFSYSTTPGGGLRIEREGSEGRLIEEYLPDGRSVLSKEEGPIAEGGLRRVNDMMEYFERTPGDEDGSLELFYTIEALGPDRYRFETGRVEPIAWILMEGIRENLQGESALESLAILDQAMGAGKRVTPLLALAFIGKLPPFE